MTNVHRISVALRNMSSNQSISLLQDKFRGCLVGALVGDCLGSVFEGLHEGCIASGVVANEYDFEKMAKKAGAAYKYTDDSAMTMSICRSFINRKRFDAVDLVTMFTEKYLAEPDRGYGNGMCTLFEKWKQRDSNDDVYEAGKTQFNGSGSFGNGAAMRISPVALFAKTPEQTAELARMNALLTHTNPHGYNGAMLQAIAVHKLLSCNHGDLNRSQYIHDLTATLRHETAATDPAAGSKEENEHATPNTRSKKRMKLSSQPSFSFVTQLERMALLLSADDVHHDNREEAVRLLGNNVSAQAAVPAALYSFLKYSDRSFEDVLLFAIGLGGDTDTIASMACALAGAYMGYSNIPHQWLRTCEDHDVMLSLADQLFRIHDVS